MSFRPFLATLCLGLAACTAGGESAEEGQAQAEEGAGSASSVEAAAEAEASSGGARSVDEENELYSFEYAYPAAAGAIPALAQWLDADLAESRQKLIAQAEKDRDEAESSGFPYNPHHLAKEWKVVADLPRWLSLSADIATYMGGAHGLYGLESLVWDKEVGRGFPAIEMFTSPAALGEALGDRLCEALDAEREERRGEPVPQDSDDPFARCVGVEEATVLVGSSNGRTFDRITVWFGPYAAGPYAEGSFEFDFPVDVAVFDAVRPGFRSAFSNQAPGSRNR